MHSAVYISSLAALAVQLRGALAGFDRTSFNNIATYWGQNSAGGPETQKSLATYCEDPDIDIIPMAFLTQIKTPVINLANIGDTCTTFPGTSLLHCPKVGVDIRACQDAGKTILLSIGGATYTEGGFASDAEATAAADGIWASFGPRPSNGTAALRPFDDAAVDGFDLDFESAVAHMPAFASRLRALMDAAGPNHLLTAAPQCPYPDAAEGDMLDGAVAFDIVWVQFYNNYCGLNHYMAGVDPQPTFNFATWDRWAHETSKNPDVKVMVGAPAAPSAAGQGYVDAGRLAEILEYAKGFKSFSGAMFWDVSQAYGNAGFLDGVKTALGGAAKRVMRRGLRMAAA